MTGKRKQAGRRAWLVTFESNRSVRLNPRFWRASLSLCLSATVRGVLPLGARTMTEAQALALLLFVVLLFVAYGVWDLSHHR
jgi:TRAP-type C4-dicarboxylate transport system permease large subunit